MSAGSSLLRKRKNEKTASSRRTVADGLMSATGPLLTLAIGPEAVRSALPGREDGSRGSTSGTSTFKPETPARRTGWLVLKEVLKTVGDGSDLFLPLKAAVVGVVALMDAMDNVEDARSGFSEIARKIEGFQVILSRYNSEQDIPPDIRRRLDRFVTELGSIEKVIKTKTERGAARRAIEALGDIQDIENVFRALATMAEEFKVSYSHLQWYPWL
ncbi:hypothetical protein OBBRIDRAFT_804986 [Obba rivulosa]|uniref:Uncharacterized protein n=1 Tax=Obba rivulosa TaxID=1052685 RepID=A0A8E2AQC7_9APHY|nr:hypothetical protein OBBRIDRAFT_804986 [Obba rivulosa]